MFRWTIRWRAVARTQYRGNGAISQTSRATTRRPGGSASRAATARRGRRGAGRLLRKLLAAAVLAGLPALLLPPGATPLQAQAAAADGEPDGNGGAPALRLIEGLYREGESYRTESEILRFLHEHPGHPRTGRVELARAKLYYREARYPEAERMLFSLLDRHPRDPAVPDARTLLAFSQVRQGRWRDAERWLGPSPGAGAAEGGVPPPAELADPPAGTVDADGAVAWSTWLPGSGYFLLDQPGKAVTGLTLNLAFLGAALLFAQDDNPGAAALFLVFELMLYQGGRAGVRQDAEALNRRLRERQTADWLARRDEPRLLSFGVTLRFGGE
jgi:hypothetical protein